MHTSFLARDFHYKTLKLLEEKGMFITGGKFVGNKVYYVINKGTAYTKSQVLDLVA